MSKEAYRRFNMLSIIKLFSNSKYFKWGLIALLSFLLYKGAVGLLESAYKAGYNEAKAMYLEEAKEAHKASEAATEAQIQSAIVKLEQARVEREEARAKAAQLQELLDNTPTREVIREIPKIVSDCKFGDDFSRVFQSLTEQPKLP